MEPAAYRVHSTGDLSQPDLRGVLDVIAHQAIAQGRELLDKALRAAKGKPAAEQGLKILDLGLRESERTMETFRAFRLVNRKVLPARRRSQPQSWRNFAHCTAASLSTMARN